MDVQKFSPLTEASFFILLALNEPNHGYGIIKYVEEKTDGRLKLAPGTLYGVITTFLRNKLISLEKIEGPKKKKTYRTTELGFTLLNHEVSRLKEMVDIAMEVSSD